MKPCPFCGDQPTLTTHMGESWVSCRQCLASASMRASDLDAIVAWNRRTTTTKPRKAVK